MFYENRRACKEFIEGKEREEIIDTASLRDLWTEN